MIGTKLRWSFLFILSKDLRVDKNDIVTQIKLEVSHSTSKIQTIIGMMGTALDLKVEKSQPPIFYSSEFHQYHRCLKIVLYSRDDVQNPFIFC